MRVLGPCLLVAALVGGCGRGNEPSGTSSARARASDLVGTWQVDVDAVAPDIDEMVLRTIRIPREGKSEEDIRTLREAALENMRPGVVRRLRGARLVFHADGTFAMRTETPGESGEAVGRGTWSREGDILTLVQVEERGEMLDAPETITGTLEGRRLRVKPTASAPFRLVFRRME